MIKAVPPARFTGLGDFPMKRRLPDKNDLRSGFYDSCQSLTSRGIWQ
jgi:hypothetical protein